MVGPTLTGCPVMQPARILAPATIRQPGIEFTARHSRIERVEKKKTGDEPADMRLPRDLLSLPGYPKRAQTEERVQANPYGEEDQESGVAQRRGERRRPHAAGLSIALPAPHRERAAQLKHEAHRSAGNRHNRALAVWLGQIKGRAKVIALGPKKSEDRSDSEADGSCGFLAVT